MYWFNPVGAPDGGFAGRRYRTCAGAVEPGLENTGMRRRT
jgi:hypothetical protein